ncbi:MAG TPA: FHA domain-containing protein [Kofleriaceae bacterium]|nr:FHA domain-containing protein [Kofleriaceae bacterium]
MRSLTRALCVVATIAVGLSLGRVAIAAPELKFETKAGEKTDKVTNPAPQITVTVIGGTALAPDAFVLRQTDSKLAGMKAAKVTPYVEGPEPVAIAVLVFGDANWLNGRKELVTALETSLATIATSGPPGSQGMVLMYRGDVEVRKPIGPLAELASVKLAPKDAAGPKTERDLTAAVKRAIAELDKVQAPRKALYIVGDGIDGAGSKTPSGSMRDLQKQLAEKNIIAFAAAFQIDAPPLGAPQPPPTTIDPKTGEETSDPAAEEAFGALDSDWRKVKEQAVADLKILVGGQVQKVTSAGSLDSAASGFTTLLDDRYYVTFNGFDGKLRAGFTWDGKEHPLMLRIDGQDTTSTPVALTPSWSPPGGGSMWWIWLIIGGGAVVVVGGVVATRKKPVPPPPPPQPVAAPVGPPVPAGPAPKQKTMFVGMGDDSVFPQVAWMVYMTGPKKHRFVKLHPGTNKIGTGGSCEVVVDDGFMSTEHTLVFMLPDGFYIQDNNSTNGTFLNDAKLASKQDLYDNDLILVGKTVLKFKSVT